MGACRFGQDRSGANNAAIPDRDAVKNAHPVPKPNIGSDSDAFLCQALRLDWYIGAFEYVICRYDNRVRRDQNIVTYLKSAMAIEYRIRVQGKFVADNDIATI